MGKNYLPQFRETGYAWFSKFANEIRWMEYVYTHEIRYTDLDYT